MTSYAHYENVFMVSDDTNFGVINIDVLFYESGLA
jgi:hypothetical protein